MHINLFDKGVLINPYKLPLLNTAILLLSGAFLTLSHKFLKIDRFLYAICALIFTIFLALSFIGRQIYEYTYSGFSMNDGVYGSLFYMLTGFHGFHVIIGTIFLTVCLGKFLLNHFTRTDHLAFECAI
jgi:cytochrome c oxidase subunit 3